jgi:hypothetical protein
LHEVGRGEINQSHGHTQRRRELVALKRHGLLRPEAVDSFLSQLRCKPTQDSIYVPVPDAVRKLGQEWEDHLHGAATAGEAAKTQRKASESSGQENHVSCWHAPLRSLPTVRHGSNPAIPRTSSRPYRESCSPSHQHYGQSAPETSNPSFHGHVELAALASTLSVPLSCATATKR